MKKLKLLSIIYGFSCIGLVILFFLQIILSFKIIDFYLLFFLEIASIGLFITSLSCVKEIKNKEK